MKQDFPRQAVIFELILRFLPIKPFLFGADMQKRLQRRGPKSWCLPLTDRDLRAMHANPTEPLEINFVWDNMVVSRQRPDITEIEARLENIEDLQLKVIERLSRIS